MERISSSELLKNALRVYYLWSNTTETESSLADQPLRVKGLAHQTSLIDACALAAVKLNLRNLTTKLVTVTEWHSLGIHLDVPSDRLKKIEQDFHGSDRRKSEVLSYWLENCPQTLRTWKTIADALKQIDHNNLANRLEKYMYVENLHRNTDHLDGNDNNVNRTLTHRRQGNGSSGVRNEERRSSTTTHPTPARTCTWKKSCKLLLVVLGVAVFIGIASAVWLNSRTALDEKPKMTELYLLQLPNQETVNIVERVAVSFREFGCHLLNDTDGNKVENLYQENRNKGKETTVGIFKKWLAGSGTRPVTWRTLIGVLEDMKEHELVRQIKEALNSRS